MSGILKGHHCMHVFPPNFVSLLRIPTTSIRKYSQENEKLPKKQKGVRAGIDCNAYKRIVEQVMDDCLEGPCLDEEYPRFDEMYYKTSDKEKRLYQQTWCEVPELVFKPDPICLEPNTFVAVDPERRQRAAQGKGKRQCPDVAKEQKREKFNLMSCGGMRDVDAGSLCKRYAAVNCNQGRNPPICFTDPNHLPRTCKKELAPYPSYSECLTEPTNPEKVTECLKKVSMCEVWREFSRRYKVQLNTGPVKCKKNPDEEPK